MVTPVLAPPDDGLKRNVGDVVTAKVAVINSPESVVTLTV
jgi:hypothetical protein